MEIIDRIKRALKRPSAQSSGAQTQDPPRSPPEGPMAIGHQPGPPAMPRPEPGTDEATP